MILICLLIMIQQYFIKCSLYLGPILEFTGNRVVNRIDFLLLGDHILVDKSQNLIII